MTKKKPDAGKKGAKPNNTHARKLTEPELRIEAYRQYCEYIAAGKSKEAWTFDHPEITLTWKSMEKYIREFPNELPSNKKEEAEAKSLEHWNKLGVDMMVGVIPKCQPAIYQMFMRNKFGWDRENHVTHSFEPEARTLLAKFEGKE